MWDLEVSRKINIQEERFHRYFASDLDKINMGWMRAKKR